MQLVMRSKLFADLNPISSFELTDFGLKNKRAAAAVPLDKCRLLQTVDISLDLAELKT